MLYDMQKADHSAFFKEFRRIRRQKISTIDKIDQLLEYINDYFFSFQVSCEGPDGVAESICSAFSRLDGMYERLTLMSRRDEELEHEVLIEIVELVPKIISTINKLLRSENSENKQLGHERINFDTYCEAERGSEEGNMMSPEQLSDYGVKLTSRKPRRIKRRS